MFRFKRFNSEDTWIKAIVDDFLSIAGNFPGNRPMLISLAGGSTPEPVYIALAEIMASVTDLNGDYIRYILIPGDERMDVQTENDLNETMILRSFEKLIEDGQAEFIGWGSGYNGLFQMEEKILQLKGKDELIFDITYLGLGADGHTAGLFYGFKKSMTGFVVESQAPQYPKNRRSLSPEALRSSKNTRFLVKSRGKEKALALLADKDNSCMAVSALGANTIVFVLS